MRTLILGSGAMGSIFGGYLWKAGRLVLLVDTWQEHVNVINEKGLTIEEPDGSKMHLPVKAVCRLEDIPPVDLIIVFVKSYQIENALSGAGSVIGPKTRMLTLQNGIGNAEKLSKFIDAEKVYLGGTSQGGRVVSPGNVKHTIAGHTYIGKLQGTRDSYIKELEQLFNESGIPTTSLDHVYSVVWSKLIINIAFNAITALTRLRNGDLVEVEEGKKLIRMAVEEAVCVANAKGIQLNYNDPVRDCLEIGATTISKNVTSMLSDVINKRRTEIEAINGALSAEAKLLGIPTPVNDTISLLMKILEKTYSVQIQ
jgi:2-dehydropantoate 2-reductase